MFALARRLITGRVEESSLHISVRDPHRIDPALYASAYGLWGVAKLTPEGRLRLFDRLTWAPYANSIIHLQADAVDVKLGGDLGPHETPEKLELAAKDLPVLLETYKRLYGGVVVEIPGLTSETIEQATVAMEPFIALV
jgi:hypothetical protein